MLRVQNCAMQIPDRNIPKCISLCVNDNITNVYNYVEPHVTLQFWLQSFGSLRFFMNGSVDLEMSDCFGGPTRCPGNGGRSANPRYDEGWLYIISRPCSSLQL